MKSKLDQLNELGELLKLGTITQEEFVSLKNELLKNEKETPKKPKITFIQSKEALYDKGLINLKELASFREEYNSATNEDKAKMDDNAFIQYKKAISNFQNVNENILNNSKTNNRWVYFIVLIIIVGYVIIDKTTSLRKESELFNESPSYNSVSIPEKSISQPNIINHLENNHFSLNGNGNISFYINRRKTGDRKVTGTITISGGRATLQGEISILSDYSFMVYDLKGVSGYFDASINNGSSGVFYLQSNGDFDGSLSASGQSKNVIFQVK